MAKVFINSPLVPTPFRGDLGSCLIAFNLANRSGADPLQVMQNTYIVYGKPSFSSAYLIARFNQCGKYTPIRYQFQGKQGDDDWGCKATTTELASGEVLTGTLVTIAMAKAEGWWSKKDKQGRETSKWQTMPELMLQYRAATFLISTYAPEIKLGFPTIEEVRDMVDITSQAVDVIPTTLNEVTLQAVAEQAQSKPEPVAQPADVAEPQPEKKKDFTSRFFEQHKHQEQ